MDTQTLSSLGPDSKEQNELRGKKGKNYRAFSKIHVISTIVHLLKSYFLLENPDDWNWSNLSVYKTNILPQHKASRLKRDFPKPQTLSVRNNPSPPFPMKEGLHGVTYTLHTSFSRIPHSSYKLYGNPWTWLRVYNTIQQLNHYVCPREN